MDSFSRSISAAILTASYLDKTKGEIDQYMAVYTDFLRRIGSVDNDSQTRSDEAARRKPNAFYEYKRTI